MEPVDLAPAASIAELREVIAVQVIAVAKIVGTYGEAPAAERAAGAVRGPSAGGLRLPPRSGAQRAARRSRRESHRYGRINPPTPPPKVKYCPGGVPRRPVVPAIR